MSSPSISRRHLLALTTGGFAALAGCSSLPDGTLPERVVRERTRRLLSPTPDAPVPVLETHIDTYQSVLETVVPRAENRWTDIDASDLPTFSEYTHQDVEEARAFLSNLDGKPRTSETVEEARWCVDKAVGALAYAQARDGEFDTGALYNAARTTLDAFESMRVDHRCFSPSRYVPYARRIDHRRWWGARHAAAVVPGGSVQSGAERDTPSGQAALAGQHARAQACLTDVRKFVSVAASDPLGAGEPSGERRGFADALTANVGSLAAELTPLAEQFETAVERQEGYPADFLNGIYLRGRRGRNALNEARSRTREGFSALGASRTAAAFVHLHAFTDALERLDPDSPPSADEVFDEKRAARAALRERLAAEPSPAVHDHLRHAEAAIESGDLTLRYVDTHDDVSVERSHTEAWVDYHAALVAANHASEVTTVLTQW